MRTAVECMTLLNMGASEAALAAGVRAATDITGFGLLGHLHRMLSASRAAAEVYADQVPVLAGAAELAQAGFVSGGTRANMERMNGAVALDERIPPELAMLLHDAQTSGGLLLAAPPVAAPGLREDLRARGLSAAVVGKVVDGRPRPHQRYLTMPRSRNTRTASAVRVASAAFLPIAWAC